MPMQATLSFRLYKGNYVAAANALAELLETAYPTLTAEVVRTITGETWAFVVRHTPTGVEFRTNVTNGGIGPDQHLLLASALRAMGV